MLNQYLKCSYTDILNDNICGGTYKEYMHVIRGDMVVFSGQSAWLKKKFSILIAGKGKKLQEKILHKHSCDQFKRTKGMLKERNLSEKLVPQDNKVYIKT